MGKKSQVISTFLIGATLTTLGSNVFAVESKTTIERKMLAGQHRYETAAIVSKHGWTSAENVVLVNSEAIADALAATPFAKLKNAPILLTTEKSLTETTKTELQRLQAKNVFIIGGEGVVSTSVVKELTDMGIKVERISGQDRVSTAIEVAKNINSKEVAVVNGYTGLSDALSIAPVAADKGMPIIISSKDNLGKSSEYIKEKGIEKSYIVGGEGVVSTSVEKSLPNAERIGGISRNETNAKVLEKFYSEKEYNNVYIAKDGNPNESQLIDALSVSAVAGKEKSPLVLAGSVLNTSQKAYLENKTAKTVYEVGYGVNKSTVENIVKALGVKDVKPDPDPEPEKNVMSVKAINASQLKVEFGKAVDENSATDLENYKITNDDNSKEVLLDEKTSTIELSENKKSAVVTLKQGYNIKRNQTTLKVEIKNIYLDGSKDKIDNFKDDVRILSTSIPELVSVKQVGKKEYDLTFSEPVTANSNNDLRNAIRVANNQYPSEVKAKFDNNGLNANTVRVVLSSELKDGEYEIELKDGIYNYAGFKVEEGTKKFTSAKDESEIKAVVDKVEGNEVTLKFNKPIDEEKLLEKEAKENIEFYLDYKNSDYKMKLKSVENDKIVLTSNDLPLGKHKILVRYKNDKKDKIQDLWGNKFAEADIEYNLKGENAPTVKAEYNKYDNTIDFKFNKSVTGADDPESYIVTDADGEEIEWDEEIKCKDKGKGDREYSIDASQFEGICKIEIVKGKIKDTTVARNSVEPVTLEVEVADITPAEVKIATYGGEHGEQIFVRFSEAMRKEGTGSVLDMKNYLVDYNGKGYKPLNEIEDAEIDIREDDDLVAITLPDKIDTDKKVNIRIGSVADANGKFIGMSGIECKDIGDDRVISMCKIENIEDLDGKQSGEIEAFDNSTIRVYFDREVKFVNLSKIKLDFGNNNEISPISMKLVDDEDEDGNLVYRLDLKFFDENKDDDDDEKEEKDVLFKTDATIGYKNFTEGTLKFEAEALETINYSPSKAIEKPINKVIDKVPAEMIEDATILSGNRVQVKFTEPVNVNSISADTFKVKSSTVDKVESTSGKYTDEVIIYLEEETTKQELTVTQKLPIRDRFDNKTDTKKLGEATAIYYGISMKSIELNNDNNSEITLTFDKEVSNDVNSDDLKSKIKIDDKNLLEKDKVIVDGKTIKIILATPYKFDSENVENNKKAITMEAGAVKCEAGKDDPAGDEVHLSRAISTSVEVKEMK
ncbi:cell wall-binding repeat-containing protein [Clostridium ihumii]|uniref:cell wall-binding repeat-containing protein n=1 Tax=Clostridium ihumii TaxID=1470356 RepID=UPI00068911C4|nr:cell wall-binding repeat-containing protein [Clostridium ihumii]